jgi:ABC-type multidrug transport system ATPase subunit
LIDEVLAVGDESFQRKCFKYFHQIKKMNKTVIIVTHDMNTVREFCDTAMLINNSEIVDIDNPKAIAEAYGRLNISSDEGTKDIKRWGNGKAKIIKIHTHNGSKKTNRFSASEKISILILINVLKDISNPTIGIIVSDLSGRPIYATNTLEKKVKLGKYKKGDQLEVEFEFENVINDGEYLISSGINNTNRTETYSRVEEAASFVVYGRHFPHSIAHPDYKVSVDNRGV